MITDTQRGPFGCRSDRGNKKTKRPGAGSLGFGGSLGKEDDETDLEIDEGETWWREKRRDPDQRQDAISITAAVLRDASGGTEDGAAQAMKSLRF